MKQKKPLNLNPFVLIFAVVVVAWLFTFIITRSEEHTSELQSP